MNNDLLLLVPLLAGPGVMALGFKLQMPRELAMNRPSLAGTASRAEWALRSFKRYHEQW